MNAVTRLPCFHDFMERSGTEWCCKCGFVRKSPEIQLCSHEWEQGCTQAFCRKCHLITDD